MSNTENTSVKTEAIPDVLRTSTLHRLPAIGGEAVIESKSLVKHPPRSHHEADGKSDSGSRLEMHKLTIEDPGGGCPPSSVKLPAPYLQWAESFENLLQDTEGLVLFKSYLEQEGCGNTLDFWFACQGFKCNVDPADTQKISQLIKVIYRTYVRGGGGSADDKQPTVGIKVETRKAISEQIGRKQNMDQTIFDKAHQEVENSLRQTLYPAFIKSDVYVQYVQKVSTNPDANNEDESRHLYHQLAALPMTTGEDSSSSCASDLSSAESRWSSVGTLYQQSAAPVAPGGHLQGGLPLATLDETREMKSDELHHQPPLLTSVTGSSAETSKSQPTPAASSPSQTPAPLTTQNLLVSRFYRAGLSFRKPEAVAGTYLQPEAPGRPINPYHVSYAPVSTQDSELQSLSSEAHTDETRSLTDSSVSDGSHLLLPTNKKQWKHQRRAMRRSAQHNRDTGLWHTIIPRGSNGHPGQTGADVQVGAQGESKNNKQNLAETDPPAFVRLLKERLVKLAEERNKMQLIDRLLHKTMQPSGSNPPPPTSASSSSTHSSSLFHQPWAGRLMAAAKEQEDAQRILEDHCSRIWDKSADHTPPSTGTPRSTGPPPHTVHASAVIHHQHRHIHHHPPVHLPAGALPLPTNFSWSGPPHSATMPPPQPPHPHHGAINHASHQPGSGGSSQGLSDKVLAWIHESSEIQQQQIFNSTSKGTPRQSSRHTSSHPRGSPGPPPASSNPKVTTDVILQPSDVTPTGHPPSKSGFSSIPGDRFHSSSSSNVSSHPPHHLNQMECGEGMEGGLVVGYYLCGDPVPYRSNWPSKEITLGQFKQLVAKKVGYRYFFKKASNEFETGVVQEEVSNDDEILPLWEGKVVAKVEKID